MSQHPPRRSPVNVSLLCAEEVLVPSTRAGKVAAGIAGATGTGTLGIAVAALARVAGAHIAPAGLWTSIVALAAGGVLVAWLGLVLDYRRDRLELKARAADAQARAERETARLEMYRVLVEKSAGEPVSAAGYRALILADALHLAVEQNGVRPADQTHGQLFGGRAGSGAARERAVRVGSGWDVTEARHVSTT